MLIFSNKCKQEVVKTIKMVESNVVLNGYLSEMSIDFGKHIVFKNFEEASHSFIFGNLHDGFSYDAIIDDLNDITSNEVYLYEAYSSEAILREISLNELILSEDQDKFAIGCLLGARRIYQSLDTMLDEELEINNSTIYNLDKETLIDIILKKDTSGKASLIGDLLLENGDDERLYKNTIKLDQTGDLSYVFIQQAESMIEEVVEKIIETDKKGCLLIELLNWIDDNPINLAKKIIEIKNPFRIFDFLSRYDEYLDNVREFKSETGFVQSENEVKSFIEKSIANLDYSIIDFKELLSEKYYECDVSYSMYKTINILAEYKKYDSIKTLINTIKEFCKVENEEILKKSICDVRTLDIEKEDKVIVIIAYKTASGSKNFLISLKSKEEYQDLFAYLMCYCYDSIPVSRLM